MELTGHIKDFIREHLHDDVNKLLLSSARFPGINMPFVVDQILARRQIKDKLPDWYTNDDLIFPSRLSAEQCSSQLTAQYKQRLIGEGCRLVDLTGGLGIDSYYLSRKASSVTYIERYSEYAEAAIHNFSGLAATNIRVLNGDAMELLPEIDEVDVFYIDPARRGEGNKRVFALSDCEPNLVKLLPHLFEKAPVVITKISPMADLSFTLSLLPSTKEIHVVSVKNECKELLFVMSREFKGKPSVHCCNIKSNDDEEHFDFTLDEEKMTIPIFAANLKDYLYEPNASVLKAGAFKSITHLGVEKLHVNTHLYTSTHLISNFPGRSFKIRNIIFFSIGILKQLSKEIPKANIAVRNFPLKVEDIRKRTGIKDGGEVYLFASTDSVGRKLIIECSKT